MNTVKEVGNAHELAGSQRPKLKNYRELFTTSSITINTPVPIVP